MDQLISMECEGGLTSSYQMDPALQSTLKRVSRDIQVRKKGAVAAKDSKSKQPLPPVCIMYAHSTISYNYLLTADL